MEILGAGFAAYMLAALGSLGYFGTAYVSNNHFAQLPPEAQTWLRDVGMHQ